MLFGSSEPGPLEKEKRVKTWPSPRLWSCWLSSSYNLQSESLGSQTQPKPVPTCSRPEADRPPNRFRPTASCAGPLWGRKVMTILGAHKKYFPYFLLNQHQKQSHKTFNIYGTCSIFQKRTPMFSHAWIGNKKTSFFVFFQDSEVLTKWQANCLLK